MEQHPSKLSQNLSSKPGTSNLHQSILTAMSKTKLRDRPDAVQVAISLIGRLSVLINLRGDNVLEPARVQMLAEGLVKYHGNHTAEEIYLACEANQYNRLYTKVEHYGQLTPDYISACLHTYGEAKKAAVLKEKSNQANQTSNDLNYGRTPEAMWKGAVDYVKTTGELPMYWDWGRAYTYLHDTGQLDYLTIERKNEIKARMTTQVQIEQSKNLKTAGDMIGYRKVKGADLEAEVRLQCRKFVVLNHLKQYLNHEQPNL